MKKKLDPIDVYWQDRAMECLKRGSKDLIEANEYFRRARSTMEAIIKLSNKSKSQHVDSSSPSEQKSATPSPADHSRTSDPVKSQVKV